MNKQYEKNLRKKILSKIEDLKKKIKENEPCPEGPQDVSLLHHVDEELDECLNSWYY